MTSAATVYGHPYNAQEESFLYRFRIANVDLTDTNMKVGRGVRDRIIAECEALNGTPGFPMLVAGTGFGAGSFGRRTQAQPLDDIDLYLVLNAGGAVIHEDGITYTLEGDTLGPLINDALLRAGQWVSADFVLQRFAAYLPRLPIVAQYNPQTGVNPKGKSAFIKFAGALNIDLTPVVWAKRTDLDRYYMPEGRGSYLWKATNPKVDQIRLSNQNQAQDEIPLPAIRMLKWWNENQNSDRLKGIHLEVMAERAMQVYTLEGMAQALHVVFDQLPTLLASGCPDPTGLGPILDVNLSLTERQASLEAARYASAAIGLAADKISRGDVANALGYWDLVFPGVSTG